MTLTTPQAFDEFKAKLILTATQNTSVTSRRDATTTYAKKAFPSTSDLTLDRCQLIGSAQRGTITRPLDDVDLLAVFSNKGDVFERYRYDSRAFLYRVRDALNTYSNVQLVGARGQAVRFFYKDRPHVDVAPVFRWSTGGYGLPNGSGGWLTTDPEFHATYIDKRNAELNNHLKPMIRMMKRWNDVHSKHLKSFHIEVMLSAVFSSLGGDSRDACEKFFLWAQSNLNVTDPSGPGGDLSAYLAATKRLLVIANLESSRVRAANANAAERRGDHAESIRLWRLIFGDEFPAYG